jgi:transcriptional regulator with XRE-family HTH domain
MKMKIRDMREDHDLTQQQIAEYLKCDQSLYSKYEREERDVPLHIMVKLAVFYKTIVDYLVGLTNEKAPYPRAR